LIERERIDLLVIDGERRSRLALAEWPVVAAY
jgi:hypothetical protein